MWDIDDDTCIQLNRESPQHCSDKHVAMVKYCDQIGQRIAEHFADEDRRKRATEAGYDDVNKYVLDGIRKNPIYPARWYLECVNEYGAESTICSSDKERWLELKTAQIGKKLVWNEEEVYKILKEDAIEAGYEEGYFAKKDPKFLEYSAIAYEKCIAHHGVDAENTACEDYKKIWLEAKAFQNVM